MKVLCSSKAFQDHYAIRSDSVVDKMKSASVGGVTAGVVTGVQAVAAGTAAAQASVWSTFASWPLVGGFAAGKATAAGVGTGVAALASSTVLVPALAIGAVAAYIVYRNRKKVKMQKGSRVEDLAHAFARVACLPMMAVAVSICQANPQATESVRDYVLKEMGAWGYAESYIRASFDEAMAHSAAELDAVYRDAVRKLESGSTEGIGATPAELPADAVKAFADDFRENIESCVR